MQCNNGISSEYRDALCSVSQRVAVCCSVLQCVAVCCSVLQCVELALRSVAYLF